MDFHGPDYEILLSAYLGFGGTRPLPPPPRPPPPPPPKDTDGDGIPDTSDACPTEPGPRSDNPKKNGCPLPKDTDGDGILDVDDACPTEPGPKSDDPTKNGCPPPKDTDGDGIPDNIDKCPNEPETFNGYQDEDGCPDEVPAALKKFTGVIEGITFKTNSANITKKSYDVLDQAVQVLSDYPDTRIEISGHTDNVGKDEYNKELSQKRADAVKDYFVKQGHQGRAADRDRLWHGEAHRRQQDRGRQGQEPPNRVQARDWKLAKVSRKIPGRPQGRPAGRGCSRYRCRSRLPICAMVVGRPEASFDRCKLCLRLAAAARRPPPDYLASALTATVSRDTDVSWSAS